VKRRVTMRVHAREGGRIVGCEFVVAVQIVGVAEILERDVRVMIAVACVGEILHLKARVGDVTMSRRSEKVGVKGRGGRGGSKVIGMVGIKAIGMVGCESRVLVVLVLRVLLLRRGGWRRLRPWEQQSIDVRREMAKAFDKKRIAPRGGRRRMGGRDGL